MSLLDDEIDVIDNTNLLNGIPKFKEWQKKGNIEFYETHNQFIFKQFCKNSNDEKYALRIEWTPVFKNKKNTYKIRIYIIKYDLIAEFKSWSHYNYDVYFRDAADTITHARKKSFAILEFIINNLNSLIILNKNHKAHKYLYNWNTEKYESQNIYLDFEKLKELTKNYEHTR